MTAATTCQSLVCVVLLRSAVDGHRHSEGALVSQNLKLFQGHSKRHVLVAGTALAAVAGAAMIFSPLVPASGASYSLSREECYSVTSVYGALGQALSPDDPVLDAAQAKFDKMSRRSLANITGQERVNLRARPGAQDAAPDKMTSALRTAMPVAPARMCQNFARRASSSDTQRFSNSQGERA